MAIGKAGAYATVTAPNVDFGKIALNAQQAQQADFEMIKSMIPKPEKKEKFEYEKLPSGVQKTGNGGYDESMTKIVDDTTTRVSEITKTAESRGYYTQDEKTEINKLNNTISGYNNLAGLVKDKIINYSKGIEEGIFSPIDSGRQDYMQKVAEKKNLELKRDENGQFIFKVVATDKDGNRLQDSKGNLIYEKFNDRGVERDYISENEFENGSIFNKAIKEFDSAKTIGTLQNNLKLRTSVVDANGMLTRTKTFLNDDDYDVVDNAVTGVLGIYDNLSSYLYSLDREKYETPKTMEQYKEDGDLDFAKKEMTKGILSGLGFQNKEDRIAPKSVTNVNIGKEDKNNYVSPTASEDIRTYTYKGKDKGKVAKQAIGYTLSVNQNDDNIYVGSNKAQLEGVGYDNITKRFFISYYGKVSKSDKISDVSSESRSVTEKKRIYLNGKEANVSLANTLIPKLSFKDNDGNIRSYQNTGELIEVIKEKDPNGKYFGGKVSAKGVGSKYNDK